MDLREMLIDGGHEAIAAISAEAIAPVVILTDGDEALPDERRHQPASFGRKRTA
jgi:hypothetical protein